MAAVTENDLEQKRAKVEKLREQIAAAEAKAATAVQDQSNAIEAAALDAEAARLEARLAAAKEQAKVSNVKDGSAELSETLKAAMKAAESYTPPGVAVDTNAENPPNDTGATVATDDEKKG